jgi:CPA2 family monovalent cation:H+ antiporter-2
MTYATSIVVSLFFSNSIGGNKFLAVILMTLIFASTFAGLVVPLIHNEGLSHTVIGKLLAAISNLSEALSILFLTIFMIATDVDPAYWIVVLLIAVLIITLMIIKKYKFGKAFSKITEGIDHFATRIVIVVILGLVILSDMSGGEYILGAFIAGILVHQADFSEDIIHSLSRVIYGIFAPMFFILVGTRIDIMNYIREPESLLMVLYIFIGLLACELPVLYLLKWYRMNTVAPSMLLLSCTIVVPIAANHINEILHLYTEEFGDALILASLLLCVFGTILFQINFPFGNIKKTQHESISEDK